MPVIPTPATAGSRRDLGEASDPALLLSQALAALQELQVNLKGVLAKLDLDAGVTDTNFAALWNPTILMTDPPTS